MAKKAYQTQVLESFQGGLNFRTDQFNVSPNESPDLLNVDVDPRGGVKLRNGVAALNSTQASAHQINGLGSFFTDSGTAHIIANTADTSNNIKYSSGGNFSTLSGPTARTSTSRMYGMTMNNVFYGVSGDLVSFKWDGSSGADLGTDIDGTAGNFPIAQYVTFWNNLAWVGKTREPSTYHNSRLRWSNINDPEKWSATDYVDIDVGERGDVITGLVPLADRLLIFKNNSVHAMYGFGSDSFQVTALTRDVGSIALSSPVSTPYGVFFWHDRAGVYLYNGEQFINIFEKLRPAIDNGRISFTTAPQLAWYENRLYVTVDMLKYYETGSVTARHTFIFDPSIEAWTLTDINATTLHVHSPPAGLPTLLGTSVFSTSADKGRAIKLEESRSTDSYNGSASTRINAYFTTPWMSGKNPVVKKRWGRPQIVLDASSTLTMPIEVYSDYDKSSSDKTIYLNLAGRESSSTWESSGSTTTWASGSDVDGEPVGGTGVWASEAASTITDIVRLQSLGMAKAIALKINGPSQSSSWEINGLMFTYKNRKVR
jgi:hypothetical protein